MTDDQLMLMARAAGFSMIPPQDPSEAATEPAVATLAAGSEATYLTKLRAALPAAPSVTTWFQTRAPA